MRSRARSALRLLIGPALLVAGAPAVADTTVTADQVFEVLGFDPAQRVRVRGGEIVTRGFEERTDRQLSVALAMIVHAPMERLIDDLRSGKMVQRDRALLSHGEIQDATDPARDLAGVRIPSGEIDDLLGARPGSKFNFSTAEYARFDTFRKSFSGGSCSKSSECAGAVADAYRAILAERVAAYRGRGLDGIAPYARDSGKSSDPAAELRAAAEGLRPMTVGAARLLEAFLRYPNDQLSVFEHHFFWLEQTVQDRSTLILSHRLLHVDPGMAFLAERQFYVGHSYNAMQVLAGLLPTGEATLVFYLNRTSTDQVAGALSGVRHDAGRRIMAKEIREHFEQLRAAVGAK